MLHCLDVFFRSFRSLVVWVIKLTTIEELGSLVSIATSPRGNLLDQLGVDLAIADSLHHGQMLEIIVCLKQGISSKEFNNYASYAPDIARKTPAELEDNFWSPVMPCRNNG